MDKVNALISAKRGTEEGQSVERQETVAVETERKEEGDEEQHTKRVKLSSPQEHSTTLDMSQPELHMESSKKKQSPESKDIQENNLGDQDEPSHFSLHIDLSDEQKNTIYDDARSHGFWDWLEKYHLLTMQTLYSAFDAPLPAELTVPTISFHDALPHLRALVAEKCKRREKRPEWNTIEDAVYLLQHCKRIMVVTGAGVSVSCGIPDFRSKNGIYSRLDEFELEDPQQMFDIHYFRHQPRTFYTFAKEIYPSNFTPSMCHKFIRVLEKQGKLLRNYTQNIDTLEQKAGITRIIQCHGSFALGKCISCNYTVPGSDLEEDIFAQTVPYCSKCIVNQDDDEEADHAVARGGGEGIMKPSITFFGEPLPKEFDQHIAIDKEEVDCFIVIGSSLKVSPVADIKGKYNYSCVLSYAHERDIEPRDAICHEWKIDKIPHHVPQILINREFLPHMRGFDIQLLGDCDVIVAELARRLGWEIDHPTWTEIGGREHSFSVGTEPHRFLFEGAVEFPAMPDSEDDFSTSEDGSSSEETDTEDDSDHEDDKKDNPELANAEHGEESGGDDVSSSTGLAKGDSFA